jgi:cyanocobalamin reductase (cyanide-eliminating) / alkylcobalamin dealkylase
MPLSTDVDLVVSQCREAGLDLHATTSVGRYNVEVEPPFQLPGADTSLVIVIGNSRAMWAYLDRFVLDSPEPIADPVDTYVEQTIRRATAQLAQAGRVVDIRFDHEPPPRRIAIQRLAHVAGMAWLSPSHLCIHPTFGPWIALRAAIVLDQPAPPVASPTGVPLPPPCDCSTNCEPLLNEALAAGEPTNSSELVERWKVWLAVRDGCPVGREHRYSDEQIVYHYTGERPGRWG